MSSFETDGNIPNIKLHIVPVISDYHVVYSTLFGHTSWRSTEEGSIFVTRLCRNLKNMAASADLQTILHQVRADMMNWNCKQEENSNVEHATQICEDQSTLTAKVYFHIKYCANGLSDLENDVITTKGW